MSRLARPGSGGSKSSRKERPENRSCMLRIGERLMRAGSEGNLVQRALTAPTQNLGSTAGLENAGVKKECPGKNPAEDPACPATRDPTPRSPGPRGSAIVMEVGAERQLQRKHQTRAGRLPGDPNSAWHPPGSAPCRDTELDDLMPQHLEVEGKKEVFLEHLRQKYPHPAAIITGQHEHHREQVRSHLPSSQTELPPLDIMSDREDPHMISFTRGCRTRASLPAGSSRETSWGVLYLQFGKETRQVTIATGLSGLDALRSLFVSAFPQQLSMKMLRSPNMAISIKDPQRNLYYQLEDVRNITSQASLKVYHKDPSQVFKKPVAAEGRLSKEVLYGNHSPVHRHATLQGLQGSMSPPTVRSMPSSPSRMAYGGRGSFGLGGGAEGGVGTLPRERLSGAGGRTGALCAGSSTILERRDVKPDEDAGGTKSVAVFRGEGVSHQSSYCSSLQDGVGASRGGLWSSSQCSAPPSLGMLDGGIPGLQQYRASIKPLAGFGEGLETRSLHRQKSRRPSEGLPAAGPRVSPLRHSLQRDSDGSTPVFTDGPMEAPDRLIHGHITTNHIQSERMKAMEEQIASLTGLVHHALSLGPDPSPIRGPTRENSGRARDGLPSEPGDASIQTSSPTPEAPQALPPLGVLRQNLASAKRNVWELRLQLNHLRNLQLSNQDAVGSMLRTAGQALLVVMFDLLARSEEVVRGRRAQMEGERIHYLAAEENILQQLSDLEGYVNHLQTNLGSTCLKDVEEGAVTLRRVGEALAILKGEFPELQVKMRSVLRLEVEAVRFLKEEPHKMDSMLKRVKALTEALGSLRRCVSESPAKVPEGDQDPLPSQSSPRPRPRPSVRSPVCEVSTADSASPAIARRMKPIAGMVPPQIHHPSCPLTPTRGPDSPTVAKVSPRSRAGSPALQRRRVPPIPQTNLPVLVLETGPVPSAERGPPEGEQKNQPSCSSTDLDQVLQDAQASLMKSISDLVVTDSQPSFAPGQIKASAPKSEAPMDLDQNLQACLSRPDDPGDQVDSSPAAAVSVEPPPSATPSAAPSASPSLSRSRPPVEKPRRSSLAWELKQSPDRVEMPPPSPPKRLSSCPGGAMTRTMEVVYTARGEAVAAQDCVEKELPVTPQPNNPQQPLEVKPKPQVCRIAPPAGLTPAMPSARREKEEEDTFMKELQVTTLPSDQEFFPGKSDQSGGETSPPFRITSGLRWAPQSQATDAPLMAVGSEGGGKSENAWVVSDEQEKGVQKQELNSPPPEKKSQRFHPHDSTVPPQEETMMLKQLKITEEPLRPLLEETLTVCTAHSDKRSREQADSLTLAETTFTTIVTLQTEDLQAAEPEGTNDKPINEVPAGTQSTDMDSRTSDTPTIPFTFQSGKKKIQEQISKVKATFIEDCSLSPEIEDSKGSPPLPLPPPLAAKVAFQILKSKDTQTRKEDGTCQPRHLTQENSGFQSASNDQDQTPIFIVLNEPEDAQSNYKRLSTIFECEEDMEVLLPPESVLEEEGAELREKEEEETSGRNHREMRGNVLHQQPQEAPSDNGSVPQLKAPVGPDPSRKMEAKRKFKFKFPRNKLVALTEAIRSGTSRTAKKTLNFMVYEEEEALDSRSKVELSKKTKEPKTFEIRTKKLLGLDKTEVMCSPTKSLEDPCRSTQDCKDLQEESFRQVESVPSPSSPSSVTWHLHRSPSGDQDRSPPKRPASQGLKGPKPPQSKRAKAQSPSVTLKSPKKQTSSCSSTSSTLRSQTRSQHSASPAGPSEPTPPGQQLAPQPSQSSMPSLILHGLLPSSSSAPSPSQASRGSAHHRSTCQQLHTTLQHN